MKNYILIISHMRSYSSLLSHILGSHPEINGYAECHQSYQRLSDFQLLEEKIASHYDAAIEGRYLLDKILHNRLKVSKSVLRSERVTIIFLVREPFSTMQSILRMSELRNPRHWFSSPEKVAKYYIKRLKDIRSYAGKSPYKAFFIDADRIIHDTKALLNSLTGWLELATPLKPDYKIFKLTGTPGKGDPTPMIMKGRIERNPGNRYEYPVPEKLSAKADAMYRKVTLCFQGKDILH